MNKIRFVLAPELYAAMLNAKYDYLLNEMNVIAGPRFTIKEESDIPVSNVSQNTC